MLHVLHPKTKALLDLADFFENLDPALYDQRTYHDRKSGSRCICGWQNARIGHTEDDCDKAAEMLGLGRTIANDLFRCTGGQKVVQRRWIFPDVTEKPTPKEAAACLRHLAITGELPAAW